MASVGVSSPATVRAQDDIFTRDSRLRSVVLSLLLIAATFAVYYPVHNHPFVNIDDPKYVTQNPHIAGGLTPAAVFWAFTHGYSGNYHPVTWVSHAVDISLFGYDPAPHHDENVLLHAIDAVLLFWVLRRATSYTWRSFMVAALFALHPVNVESVAWIAERKTMLSTLFCLLALGAYRWYASKPGVWRYVVMSGLFVLGLFSKPQIIMLPLVLLLWDYWPLQRMFAATPAQGMTPKSFWWLVMEKAPLFFICLVDAGVTMIAQHAAGAAQPFGLPYRLQNVVVSYVRYVGKALWPSNLGLYYPHPGRTLHAWQVGGALALLLLVTALAARARRHRYLIVGWLWFLIMLVPCIGLVQVDVQGMADRYAYVSFIGLFLMICWGVADWAAGAHLPRALLPAVTTAVLLALALLTYRQVGFWQDDVTLWAHSAEVTRGNWKAEYMLAASLDAEGRHDLAMPHFFRAEEIYPHDPFINIAIAEYEQQHGNPGLAVQYYQKALPGAWNAEQKSQVLESMAASYRLMGDNASADACLAQINALPRRTVNWQGSWWQQLLPMIKSYFHSSATEPKS